ncbi:Beta-hexosaminidase [Acidisarcina polymorpha]|uniref:Beta-hexosaminidase n=1 Tax=Acidisarcina polymorpha TaxID=2211140 RepID=A0A2Z5FYZ9_9BACT|nr:family 20 glycosylhydrolase [Acidisarcina polymorpha]AXC11707.1 Beta-hexosaminidase [Acidisarcina polymorpha]
MKVCGIAFCLLIAGPAGNAADLNLMPWPSAAIVQDGFLTVDHALRIEVTGGDDRVRRAVARFLKNLSTETGVPYDRRFDGTPDGATLSIRCTGVGRRVQAVDEDESYHLSVSGTGVELTAANPLGILHGLETLLQLVEPGPHGWRIPYVRIDDAPRFAWRGMMIDVSRHFMPLQAIERNVDGMAEVKLNVLHLHLSDDEGFRVESRRCPKLTGAASGGLFYTQSQIRELIAYARNRGIRVVPEFDVPGHAVSWIVAYPRLASGTAPARLVQSQHDDLRPPLNPTQDSTYKLLETAFGEMAKLFPDAYFHIGGDEVDGKYWDHDPEIQRWMRSHGIKDNHALQTYFTRRVEKIVHKDGKIMEGWDEILDSDLPKQSLIQSWRGADSLASAAQSGYKTILSAGYYLDLMHSASYHYAVDPLAGKSAALSPAEKANILGGEAAQWTEYVTPENLDNRIWPRMGAIAERLWSAEGVTDVDSMYRRLSVLSRSLAWRGLEHETGSRMMLGRIEGDDLPAPLLETLAMAVEPVKEYDREQTQVYDVTAPLNRLVDSVPPESDYSRSINALAARAAHDASVRLELRRQFSQWRDNDARLEPYLAASHLRLGLAPLSQDLSKLGVLGLAALDAIEAGKPISVDSRNEQLALVQATAAHHAELLLAVTPSVRVLIEAEPGTQ